MKSKFDQRFRWKGQKIKMGLRRGNIPSTEIVQFSFTKSNVENYGSVLDLLTLRRSKSQDPRGDLIKRMQPEGAAQQCAGSRSGAALDTVPGI